MASRHIDGGLGKPASGETGILSRIRDAFARRRARKFAAWLEAGDGEFPSKLASRMGVEKAVISAHNAYMGGRRENAIKALQAMGMDGKKELKSLCARRAGAERALAAEMLGFTGDADDLDFLAKAYFKDPNSIVKKEVLLAAAMIAEKYPGCGQINSCYYMVIDAINEAALLEPAFVLIRNFDTNTSAVLASRALSQLDGFAAAMHSSQSCGVCALRAEMESFLRNVSPAK